MPSTLLSISSLLFGAFILLMGNGLVGILLPVHAAAEGFSTNVIGAVASAYSVGFVLSCFLTAHVVSRVGHIRTFAVLAAIGASSVLTMGLFTTPLTWIGLRAITGFCFAGLFMVIESWLNERASNQNRGQIFATYMVINMSAVTAGTMLLPAVTSVGITAFALICILITLSLVPVSLTKSDAPTPMGKVRIRLIRLFRISPVGAMGCLIVGLANGAYSGLGVIYAHSLGLSETEVALFMSAAVIGGAFSQIPLGRLSDRMDRRWVILAAVFFSASLGMILATWGGLLNGMQSAEALTTWIKGLPPSASIILIGFYGFAIFPVYSLCVAHTNDFAERTSFVETSGGLLMVYGIGAIFGPFLGALFMGYAGPGALFAYTAAIHAAFFFFILYRMTRRAAAAQPKQGVYLETAGQVRTPAAASLDPRSHLPAKTKR